VPKILPSNAAVHAAGGSPLAETMKDAASIPAPVEVIEGLIKDDEVNRLY
jgi:hypothetical protein